MLHALLHTFRSSGEFRRSLAAFAIVGLLVSVVQPLGVPAFEPLKPIEPVAAQALTGGRWVQTWGESCTSACDALGMEATTSPAGDACASGENTILSAYQALGDAAFQAGCWPNSSCAANVFGDGKGTTSEHAYCYAPGQERDNDPTDKTAACYCAQVVPPAPPCQDGIDNDGDGAVDGADYSCQVNPGGDESTPKAACQDGVDNDGDGLRDMVDPGCSSPQDNDESNAALPECSDRIDNDGDGKIDYAGACIPTDGCSTFSLQGSQSRNIACDGVVTFAFANDNMAVTLRRADTNQEVTLAVCDDDYAHAVPLACAVPGDNGVVLCSRDGGLVANLPKDINGGRGAICPRTDGYSVTVRRGDTLRILSSRDGNEGPTGSLTFTPTPGGDGSCRDVQPDPQCSGPNDPTEKPACNDGIDNDGDGAVDLQDFSCQGNRDKDDESTPLAQCQDGVNNDGDRYTDFPQDPSCSSLQDNSEDPNDDPQFTVTKEVQGAVPVEGGTITYVVKLKNTGYSNQTNVQLVDVPGPGLTFVPSSPAECSLQGGQVVCAPITVVEQQTKTYTFTFRVEKPQQCPVGGFSVSNAAKVVVGGVEVASTSVPVTSTIQCTPQCNDQRDNDGDGAIDYPADFSCSSPTDDDETNPKAQCQDGQDNDGDGLTDYPADPGCDSPQDNTEFNEFRADLEIVKEKLGAPTIQRGETVTYRLTAINHGPNTATNVALQDQLPPGFTFVPSASSPSCILHGGSVVCDNLTLPAQQSASVLVALIAPTSIACGASVTNTATVATSATDPNSSNNTDTVTSSVVCPPPSFSLTKTDNRTTVAPNETLTYTLTARNVSETPALNVLLRDTLPSGVTFLSADAGGQFAGGVVTWTIASLAPNASITRSVTVRVQASVPHGTVLQNTATLGDAVATDTTSVVVVTPPQCSDGQDNDGDGLTDYPADPGCSSPQDNDESNPSPISLQSVVIDGCNVTVQYHKTASTCAHLLQSSNFSPLHTQNFFCANDGPVTRPLSDFLAPFAPGLSVKLCDGNNYSLCSSPVTVTGGGSCNPVTQCSDSQDNDGDGLIDYPQDPGCSSPQDNDESNVFVADLFIMKSAVPEVQRNETLLYTLTAYNAGPHEARNVAIQDVVPAGLVFDPVHSDASCILHGSSVVCDDLTLAPGANATVFVAFHVPTTMACGAVVQNTATVATLSSDPNPTNNTSQTVSTIVRCPEPSFSLSKTDGRNTVAPGQQLTYTLTVQNTSATPAQNVLLTDMLPAYTSFVSADGGGTHLSGLVQWTIPTLAPFATVQRTVTVLVAPTAPHQTTLLNRAFIGSVSASDVTMVEVVALPQCSDGQDNDGDGLIDYPADPGCTGPQDDTENSEPAPAVDLKIDGQDGTVTRQSGQTVTLSWTSAGVARCSTGTSSMPGWPANETLPPSGTRQVTALQSGTFGIQCSKTMTSNFVVQDSVGLVVSVPPPTDADMMLDLSGPSSLVRGTTATYAVTLQNLGPATATNVVVHAPVPAGTSFVGATGASCQLTQGGTVECAFGSVITASPRTFSLSYAVPAAGLCPSAITAHASVISDHDPVSANNSDAVTTQVTCPEPETADLMITKTGDAIVTRGQTAVYQIHVTNLGPAASPATTFTDIAPPGFDYLAAQSQVPAGVTCTKVADTSSVVCTVPALLAGQSLDVTMAFTTPLQPDCSANTSVKNRVVMESTPIDPVSSNNTSESNTLLLCPITQRADLVVQKYAPESGTYGQPVTYTILAFNAGPNTAQDVVISDPVPAGTTYVSSSGAPCVLAGTEVRCTIGALASGQSTPIMSVTVLPPVPQGTCTPGSLPNTAVVTSSTQDPVSTNNTSTATASLGCPVPQADIALVKTAPSTPVLQGQDFPYHLVVTNNGPASAPSVTVTDVLPQGLSYRNATFTPPLAGASCSVTGQTVTCTLPSLAAGASQTIVLSVHADDPSSSCVVRSVTNTATATVTGANDPLPSNNASSVTTSLQCPQAQTADLAVTKTGASSVIQGQNIVYTLSASNAGPATVTNAQITDVLPQGLSFVSVIFDPAITGAACTAAGQTVTCTVPSLASAATAVVRLTAKVHDPATTCTQENVVNTASVSQLNPAIIDPNTGNNTSSVSTTLLCPSLTTADLSVTKAGPSEVTAGQNVVYTLTATNNGPSAVTSVTLSDTFPQELQFVSAVGATCQLALPYGQTSIGGLLSCPVGTLAPGASAVVTLTFSTTVPTACTEHTISNSATVSESDSAVTDPVSTNNTAVASTLYKCPQAQTADLAVTKTGASSVIQGQNIVYTLSASNAGPATVTNAQITDVLPQGLSFVSAIFDPAITGAACTAAGQTVTCTVPSLASAATAVVRLTAKAHDPATTCVQETVGNTATISQLNPAIIDPNTGNNTSSVSTTLLCPSATTADLSVTKTASATSVTRGNTVSYTLAVTNNGPAPVSQVKVVDSLLAGSSHLTYQSATFSSGAAGSCTATSSTAVECVFSNTFAVGQTASVTLTFLAPTISSCTESQTVTDKATVSESDAAVTDPNAANNESATLTTTVTCAGGTATIDSLTITKSHTPSTPTVGQYVRYSITITNTHASLSMNNLSLSDPLPSGLTYLWSSDGGTVNGSTVTWSNLTLAPGATRTLYIDATVTGSQSVTNIVTATLNGQTKTASDTFTPQQTPTYPQPPYPPQYPPYVPQPPTPYYPQVPQQPYYPPVTYPSTPVTYQQPTTPIVYQQPVQPTYVMPATGAPGDLFAAVQESGALTPVDAAAPGAQSFPAIFYATLMALLAAGSAVGVKVFGAGVLGF